MELEDFLSHHGVIEHYGVKGMKWGVRKKEFHARSIARTEAKITKTNQQINKTANRKTGFFYTKANRAEQLAALQKRKNRLSKDAEAKRQGKITPTQKKVLIGAGVVAALVATKITYNQIQSGEGHRLMMNGKSYLQNGRKTGVFPWKVNSDLARKGMDEDEIFESVVKHINPQYGRYGSKMNCRRCTFAYEMRRRGLDVAATRTSNGRGQDLSGMHNVLNPSERNWVHPGKGGIVPRLIRENIQNERGGVRTATPFANTLQEFKKGGGLAREEVNPANIFQHLSKMPNGARGELGVVWQGGGGHSMAWEIINNKPVVFDTQTGMKYAGEFRNLPQAFAKAGVTRLDNVPLNEEFLKRWITNV